MNHLSAFSLVQQQKKYMCHNSNKHSPHHIFNADFKTNAPEYAKLNASKEGKQQMAHPNHRKRAPHKRCMQIKMPKSKTRVEGSIASTSDHPGDYVTIMVIVSEPSQCWIILRVVFCR